MLASVPLLIIDDLWDAQAARHRRRGLLEIVMRRYERAILCSLQADPVEDWVSCWVTVPPSPPCSIASSITVTYSNAVPWSWRTKIDCPTGSCG